MEKNMKDVKTNNPFEGMNKCCETTLSNGGADFGPWGAGRPSSCKDASTSCTFGGRAVGPCRDYHAPVDGPVVNESPREAWTQA